MRWASIAQSGWKLRSPRSSLSASRAEIEGRISPPMMVAAGYSRTTPSAPGKMLTPPTQAASNIGAGWLLMTTLLARPIRGALLEYRQDNGLGPAKRLGKGAIARWLRTTR